MHAIFEPWTLGNLTLPNRLMRSATWEGMADAGGIANHRLAEFYGRLAAGGVGLIVTGYAYVLPWGQGLPGQCGIFSDAHLEGQAAIARAIHDQGGRVAMQLVHAGGHTRPEWIGQKPLGPSARNNPTLGVEVGELSLEQIDEIIVAFGAAAGRAKEAGFDAVQIHAAHGYLISQFLSPAANRRNDQWGGSPQKRARFCLAAYDAVRLAVGPDFPVFIKLNSEDLSDDGLQLDEAVSAAQALDQRGIDAIEVSGGIAGGGKPSKTSGARPVKGPEDEGYFLANALRIKKEVSCPVISVGGWRSPDRIAQALKQIDAVAMSRPLIRQPDLPRRWQKGDAAPATCISCGQCLQLGLEGGIACGQDLE